MQADSLALVANAQLRLGNVEASLKTANDAYALCVAIENIWGRAHCYRIVYLRSQAVLAHDRGALAEALDQLRQAAALRSN